jgi:hypothetical protein
MASLSLPLIAALISNHMESSGGPASAAGSDPQPAQRADASSAQTSMPAPLPQAPLPAHTTRWFVFELLTITAGILIALSIDGVLELRREWALVREAHAAIAFEIAENLRDLEGTLPALDVHERGLKEGLRIVEGLIRNETVTNTKFQAPLSTPSLNRASWQTADRTGALGYMEYADVKTYSELYELQDLVVESQRELVRRLPSLSSLILMNEGGDALRTRSQDLEAVRARLIESIGAVALHRELAIQLADAYKRAPKR